jgi:outer membrane protein assembly factor BamB
LAVARDGDVLAGVYGPTPRQVRLAAADGAERGSASVQGTGAREFGVHGGATEDEAGVLLFGAQDDAVYAIDPSGDFLWRFTTGGDVDAPPTLLGGGEVVVASDDGKVYLLRGD